MLCSDLLNILYIADELKKKFSIQQMNHSTVGVSIMAGLQILIQRYVLLVLDIWLMFY